jgi:hypothetical protein
MNLRERYRPIALASNVIVVTTFGVLLLLLALGGGLSLLNTAIGCGLILIANLAFVASGMLVPGLVAPGRIVFPLNVTLPLVFSAWGTVVTFLTWRIGNPLDPTLEAFRAFANLFQPWKLALFPIAQIIAMTLAAATKSDGENEEAVESP